MSPINQGFKDANVILLFINHVFRSFNCFSMFVRNLKNYEIKMLDFNLISYLI